MVVTKNEPFKMTENLIIYIWQIKITYKGSTNLVILVLCGIN
jgi:hypothetical protein